MVDVKYKARLVVCGNEDNYLLLLILLLVSCFFASLFSAGCVFIRWTLTMPSRMESLTAPFMSSFRDSCPMTRLVKKSHAVEAQVLWPSRSLKDMV